jgi:hypothetical protein
MQPSHTHSRDGYDMSHTLTHSLSLSHTHTHTCRGWIWSVTGRVCSRKPWASMTGRRKATIRRDPSAAPRVGLRPASTRLAPGYVRVRVRVRVACCVLRGRVYVCVSVRVIYACVCKGQSRDGLARGHDAQQQHKKLSRYATVGRRHKGWRNHLTKRSSRRTTPLARYATCVWRYATCVSRCEPRAGFATGRCTHVSRCAT